MAVVYLCATRSTRLFINGNGKSKIEGGENKNKKRKIYVIFS